MNIWFSKRMLMNTSYMINKMWKVMHVQSNNFASCFVKVCRYKTQSFSLRNEHKLQMFENKVLRKIFEPTK
jgi:hypothetical protein